MSSSRSCMETRNSRETERQQEGPDPQDSDSFDAWVHSCLQSECARTGRSIHRISFDAAECLEAFPWESLEQLRQLLAFAVARTRGRVLRETHFPSWFLEKAGRA